MAEWIVIVVTVVAVVALVAWFLGTGRHPEEGSGHSEPARTGSALVHGDVEDRPAGPGAEAQGVAGPGEPVAGPASSPTIDAERNRPKDDPTQ